MTASWPILICNKKSAVRPEGCIALCTLYKDAVAVVNLVLDNLCGPAGKIFYMGVHGAVLPLHLDGAVTLCLALPLQREHPSSAR